MSELSNKPWGNVNKDELLKYVIAHPNKAKDIYLKIEPNWEEDPNNRLSYPIADTKGTIYRYALSSALTYAKANNETEVINKLKKLYKQYGLVEGFNTRKVVEAFINESVSTGLLKDFINYCHKAGAPNAYSTSVDGRYYLIGIRESKIHSLVNYFIKAKEKSGTKIAFEVNVPEQGPIEVIKLEIIFK